MKNIKNVEIGMLITFLVGCKIGIACPVIKAYTVVLDPVAPQEVIIH